MLSEKTRTRAMSLSADPVPEHTVWLLCCPLPSCLSRTDMYFQFLSKIPWHPLYSGHRRGKEWDAVSQLITEQQSVLLVSQSDTLESSHPKRHPPLEVCQVYIHLNLIFIQGKGLLGLNRLLYFNRSLQQLVTMQGLCALIKGFLIIVVEVKERFTHAFILIELSKNDLSVASKQKVTYCSDFSHEEDVGGVWARPGIASPLPINVT